MGWFNHQLDKSCKTWMSSFSLNSFHHLLVGRNSRGLVLFPPETLPFRQKNPPNTKPTTKIGRVSAWRMGSQDGSTDSWFSSPWVMVVSPPCRARAFTWEPRNPKWLGGDPILRSHASGLSLRYVYRSPPELRPFLRNKQRWVKPTELSNP